MLVTAGLIFVNGSQGGRKPGRPLWVAVYLLHSFQGFGSNWTVLASISGPGKPPLLGGEGFKFAALAGTGQLVPGTGRITRWAKGFARMFGLSLGLQESGDRLPWDMGLHGGGPDFYCGSSSVADWVRPRPLPWPFANPFDMVVSCDCWERPEIETRARRREGDDARNQFPSIS